MVVCCGLLGCFGAPHSPPRSLLDGPSIEQNHVDLEVEVFRPAYDAYPHAANVTIDTVRANLYQLDLMDKTKVISCCLMLHKLSSEDNIDINAEFINQHITGYNHSSLARAEGDYCTVISFLHHNLSVECSCLHLDGFKEMMTTKLVRSHEAQDKDGAEDVAKNKMDNLNNLYLASLATCRSLATTGGKSHSTFMQTENGLFITKEIKEKEYNSFELFGDKLLNHAATGPTSLNLPWGVYKLVVNGVTTHYLVTDKLRINDASNLILFDLKGIRGRKTQDQTSTCLDDDFVNEMLRSGFSLSQHEMNTLLQCVQRDASFLEMVHVMDYSLLIGWNKSGRKIVYNIIDYSLRPSEILTFHFLTFSDTHFKGRREYLVLFDNMKKLEYASNSARWKFYLRSLPPTVIPPPAYANRLISFVRQNFRTSRASNEGNVDQ